MRKKNTDVTFTQAMILRYTCMGLTCEEIAELMGMNEGAVIMQRKRLREMLGANNMAQAAVLWLSGARASKGMGVNS